MKVPIEILAHGLRERFMPPLRLYLLLKMSCSGKIRISDEIIQDLALKLGYKSTRSIKTNLEKLYKEKWICLSKKSGYTFILGFEELRKQKHFEKRSAVILNANDLDHLPPFAAAAVITSLIQSQKRRAAIAAAIDNHIARKMRSPRLFFPISTHVMANLLNISVTQACRLRKEAVRLGYLDMQKPKLSETGWQVKDYESFINTNQINKKVVRRNGQIYFQDAFLVKANMRLKKRVCV